MAHERDSSRKLNVFIVTHFNVMASHRTPQQEAVCEEQKQAKKGTIQLPVDGSRTLVFKNL